LKPLVLALDTSHMKGSVCLTRGDDLLCEIVFDASDTHSATLMPAIETCLRTAKVSLGEVDRFAVVIGPGSFTGLRIGLATVKGFAAVRERPVSPVGSLELLAAALPYAGSSVMPLIDARRGEVYASLYDTEGGRPSAVLQPFASAVEDLAGKVGGACGGGVITCGTGSERYRAKLEEIFPAGILFCGPMWSMPRASLAPALTLERDPVLFSNLATLEPLYIRPPDARPPSSARLRDGGGR
jgi:tRNA threonylcarbamoyladenosine biosynthesis protein TsaB